MICHHSSWTVLILTPRSVMSRYPGPDPPESTLRSCGHISWSGNIYSKPCDAPPLVGNAQDCFRVAVGCMQKCARGSKSLFSHPLDQTDITTTYPIHSKCVWGSYSRLDSSRGGVQGRPHLPSVARWLLFIPKCVPASKNTNTTHGTLLVSKNTHGTCHIPSSFPRFWRSETCCKDCQQTPSWMFAHPQAKSRLGLGWSRVALMLLLGKFLCTITYSTCCWKGRYERNLAIFICRACNFPPCLRRLKSRKVWTLHHSPFSFPDPISEFWNFHKERQSSLGGSLDRSSGICYLTKRL
jgi:hypothetical protein